MQLALRSTLVEEVLSIRTALHNKTSTAQTAASTGNFSVTNYHFASYVCQRLSLVCILQDNISK
jgi:hypothetical protein